MAGPLTVLNHYGTADLTERVDQALKQAGLDAGGLTWSDLTPLDQFHVRGLAATKELAEGLSLEPGSTVIDVGCGLGGPARYLAATHGCRVTGIDLSRPFTDVARTLTERVGLSASVTYRQADALDLPFADRAFDHAWTQHVAMNIADKGRFYANIHRVLKPAGRLAIYDVVAGDAGPLIFPVPWKSSPEMPSSEIAALTSPCSVSTKSRMPAMPNSAVSSSACIAPSFLPGDHHRRLLRVTSITNFGTPVS
jgi:SAM-dependent methyltransferase